ncbi:T9SS type B sorting domain-containing protein, partial [Flavobacterium psychrotolerans]
LKATATGTNVIKWYSAAIGGSALLSTDALVDGKDYYATQTEQSGVSCESVNRLKITVIIDRPLPPFVDKITQPICTVNTGTVLFSGLPNSGSWIITPSIGNPMSGSGTTYEFLNLLASTDYTFKVTNENGCTSVLVASATINPLPANIQFEINGDCKAKQYVLTATPVAGSYNPDNVDYEWKDDAGFTIGENSNALNVSVVIASTPDKETFPLNYSLTVKSADTGCETTSSVTVKSIFCNIQKGISPDHNGSNDSFDLVNMGVKKLEIFNRYGLQVYSQMNYTDQWVGQTNNGDDLPSATYYYVIEFYNEAPQTGWIYLIRGK